MGNLLVSVYNVRTHLIKIAVGEVQLKPAGTHNLSNLFFKAVNFPVFMNLPFRLKVMGPTSTSSIAAATQLLSSNLVGME